MNSLVELNVGIFTNDLETFMKIPLFLPSMDYLMVSEVLPYS